MKPNCVSCNLKEKDLEMMGHLFENWIMLLPITKGTKITWLRIKITSIVELRQVQIVSSLVASNCHLFNKHFSIPYCLSPQITHRKCVSNPVVKQLSFSIYIFFFAFVVLVVLLSLFLFFSFFSLSSSSLYFSSPLNSSSS